MMRAHHKVLVQRQRPSLLLLLRKQCPESHCLQRFLVKLWPAAARHVEHLSGQSMTSGSMRLDKRAVPPECSLYVVLCDAETGKEARHISPGRSWAEACQPNGIGRPLIFGESSSGPLWAAACLLCLSAEFAYSCHTNPSQGRLLHGFCM